MFIFIKAAWYRLSSLIRLINPDRPLFSKPYWDAEQQRLTIEIAILSTVPVKVTMTGWQQGIEVVLWHNGRAERRDPFQASLFPIEFFELPLLQPWTDTLPAHVLSLLKRYVYNPLGFLQIIRHDRAAYELFMDHPLLFMMLYQQAKKSDLGLDWLVGQCQHKRRQIMQSCGLPSEPAAVKLLKKIVFERVDFWHLELVQALFKCDYARLSHVPELSERMLRTIIEYPSLLETRLLQNWQDHENHTLIQMSKDIRLMQTGHDGSRRHLFEEVRSCRHLDDVIRLHDRLVQLNNFTIADDVDIDLPFPEPPIVGNGNIIPLTNYAGLLEESQTQEHCVASYYSMIIYGSYYVYRILKPERATLGVNIHKSSRGIPVINLDQLKGWRNKAVGDEVIQIVKQWIEQR